ncbi:open rectifier potassium channel protein 1 isoform X2 [Episyrphus balteatus]|nr:open rectifier potassium channel protein 1 isoform X2 [Episyrphus balteatus]
MIAYSLIGIPINGILFSGLGDFFSKTFTSIYTRYKNYKITNDIRYVPPQLSLFATVCIALVPGIAFSIILPSLMFSYFENWSFATSVYYSYVTMTTIGFGDFVPTFQPEQPHKFGGLFIVYQIFIIVWFIFSLGYLVMIMTFISKGLRSKKLLMLEYQLSENIKATQHRIWSGVTKDVGYLRRILNELYIIKFKPVYNEPLYLTEKRSISCPDLSMYRTDAPIIRRKRAYSECIGAMDQPLSGSPPYKTSSDTELSNINKQKTFETAENFKQTTELLAQVVNALAYIRPPEGEATIHSSGFDGGYHGLNDSQILSSEWSFQTGAEPIPQRGRAFSDFNLNFKPNLHPLPNEWTWSGDNVQIQQAINTRYKKKRQSPEENYKTLYTNPYSGITSGENEGPASSMPRRKFSVAEGGKQLLRKLNPFKKRSSQGFIDATGISDRKFSIASVPEVPDWVTSRQDYYSTINVCQANEKKRLSGIDNMGLTVDSADANIFNQRNTIFGLDENQYENKTTTQPVEPPGGKVKKRRESLFTQNPNMRRGSMFSATANANRRGSLFVNQPSRNINRPPTNRRSSLFSEDNEEASNQEILENTTIADLIRALEVMHTQAVLGQPMEENVNEQKNRKYGTAGIAPLSLPPFMSILNPEEKPTMSGNRYQRRSTIIGTPSFPSSTSNILTQRLPNIPLSQNDPPPSYSEKPTVKFNRRFSVRPTNLHIPPGMAGSPNYSVNSSQNTSQSVVQRRLSLKPSPLSREASHPPTTLTNRGILSSRTAAPPSSSSTHSPLSRIVQISEAQRKNSEQREQK